MFVLSLGALFETQPAIAAGATLGQEHFGIMIGKIPVAAEPAVELPVALDFGGIDDATPSYVKATLLALHQCGRRFAKALTADEQEELGGQIIPLNIVVMVLNATAAVQDCIHEVFSRRGLAVLAGTHVADDRLQNAILLGEVDTAARETLTLACMFTEFQAADLHNAPGGESISVTGWNNRLAALYRQRLLRRRTEGRTHRFVPLANQVTSHGQILLRQ